MNAAPSLSILIPVYNHGVEDLVVELVRQCSALPLDFEVRVYDDGSTEEWKAASRRVQHLPGVVYQELGQNIGRSRIRNLLAREAGKQRLLFLDCDSGIPSGDFIATYLAHASAPVVVGGTVYAAQPPADARFQLHWKVGKAREERSAQQRTASPYRSITLNNILIAKEVFLSVQLDESIRTYGHEDTKFGQQLRERKIAIVHINDPVVHNGLGTNTEFMAKTREAQRNLRRLYSAGGYGMGTGVVRAYRRLERWRLLSAFGMGYGLVRPLVEYALEHGFAPLVFFDLYKLHHFIRSGEAGA